MTETEFSLVRNRGDASKAAEVYAGVTPLTALDIAECIGFAVSRPLHVNLDYLVVRPIAQATSYQVARKGQTTPNSATIAPRPVKIVQKHLHYLDQTAKRR